MRNPTYRRVLALSTLIDDLQAALGRADLLTAQHLAASMAADLQDWQLAMLRIPSDERGRYVSANPYVTQRRP